MSTETMSIESYIPSRQQKLKALARTLLMADRLVAVVVVEPGDEDPTVDWLTALVVASRRSAEVVRCEVDLEAIRRSDEEMSAERTILVMTNRTFCNFAERAPVLKSFAHVTFLTRSDEVSPPAGGAS